MSCKTKGNQGEVALKLNICKTYDQIVWSHLISIMSKMRYFQRWI